MVHSAIDNGVWAEAEYPGIKEKLHKAVDEYNGGKEETDG